jgi:hypothetical protein
LANRTSMVEDLEDEDGAFNGRGGEIAEGEVSGSEVAADAQQLEQTSSQVGRCPKPSSTSARVCDDDAS